MSDFVVRSALRVLSWITAFSFSHSFLFFILALLLSIQQMPINTALMHQRFSTPKIQVSPRERVMWRLCYFPWGFATGALLPWELQKHLREGYLWLVHAFANAAGLSQPRITEIWPLDPTLVSCDILGMCYTIQALVQPRKKIIFI